MPQKIRVPPQSYRNEVGFIMHLTSRAQGERSEGVIEEKIRNCLYRFHCPSCYNLRLAYPNPSHVFKAGTNTSKAEEWGILLGALPPIVLTALSLTLGLHWCPLAAQGLSPKASPGDDLKSQPLLLPGSQFPAPHSVLPEACPQLSKVKARTI